MIVQYRYLRRELLAKIAIEFLSLPVFLNAWVDKTHKNCIYTPAQLKLWDFHVLQDCPWFVDCSVAFYPAEEEAERKAVIGSMPLDASQDAIETNDVGFQPIQEGVVTQTGKRKRGKKVDILPTPPKVTTNDATDKSTPIDVDNFFSLSQQVSFVVQQPAGPSSSLVQVFLENTSILGLISTPSHPLLLKTHDFVKQVSIYIYIF